MMRTYIYTPSGSNASLTLFHTHHTNRWIGQQEPQAGSGRWRRGGGSSSGGDSDDDDDDRADDRQPLDRIMDALPSHLSPRKSSASDSVSSSSGGSGGLTFRGRNGTPRGSNASAATDMEMSFSNGSGHAPMSPSAAGGMPSPSRYGGGGFGGEGGSSLNPEVGGVSVACLHTSDAHVFSICPDRMDLLTELSHTISYTHPDSTAPTPVG